jgi:hypothetical protein
MIGKRLVIRATALALAAGLIGACASSPPTMQTGPSAEVTFDGLVKVDNTTMAQVWVRPDIDLNSYTELLPVVTDIQYAPAKSMSKSMSWRSNQENFPLSDVEKERFEKTAHEVFLSEFAKSTKFKLTDKPGEDVLLVKVHLLEVASRVPPDNGPGRTDVFVNTIGDAGLVVELYDSNSGQILARAVDRKEFSYPGNQLQRSIQGLDAAQVKRGLEVWGRIMVNGLDSLKTQ